MDSPCNEVTLEPCPFCGASPITDPNARGYHTSAAWECGTTRVWVNKDRLHQSGRCKDDEGRPEGHPTSNGGTQTPAEVSVNDGPVQQSPLQAENQRASRERFEAWRERVMANPEHAAQYEAATEWVACVTDAYNEGAKAERERIAAESTRRRSERSKYRGDEYDRGAFNEAEAMLAWLEDREAKPRTNEWGETHA